MEDKKPFGDYIRKKRLEAGLTQKELAGRLFVTESSVSKWERNLSCPDVSLVTSICRELRISEHEFFTACDDHQAHAQERAAARWRRAASILRWCCLAGYAAAIPVCFVCDWVLFHSLDWFWVVLAGIALSFCFTNLPFLVRRERTAVCLGAASACLLLLLLACWRYVGGHWLLGGLAITAAGLVLLWGWWAIWRFYGKHVPPLCVALTSVWVFPLLAVVHAFAGGGWLVGVGWPLAALGVAFLWAYFLCLRCLPVGPWLKAGACALITAFASPAFGWLCKHLIPDVPGPWILDYITLAVLLTLALVLLAVGTGKEMERRREG
ncbi:helix-turn-helix domain-containing protein [Flintibacter muris]|uniref:helix-turn-helix domain-containing protein n=1 Tax=Flintibacter muris TaxID=2941327 RepID=UPI00203DF372|nr:helix-turn-helix transcriptional regulator [Flintibacter muris]